MADSLDIKLIDIKPVTSKSAKSRPMIRFTLSWMVVSGNAHYGDSYAGCLAWTDDATGNTVWAPHRTRMGTTTIQHHVPSPDLIAFVRKLLDDHKIMKPLQEARDEAKGSIFEGDAIPDIEVSL